MTEKQAKEIIKRVLYLYRKDDDDKVVKILEHLNENKIHFVDDRSYGLDITIESLEFCCSSSEFQASCATEILFNLNHSRTNSWKKHTIALLRLLISLTFALRFEKDQVGNILIYSTSNQQQGLRNMLKSIGFSTASFTAKNINTGNKIQYHFYDTRYYRYGNGKKIKIY
jgi:hypothetical protein